MVCDRDREMDESVVVKMWAEWEPQRCVRQGNRVKHLCFSSHEFKSNFVSVLCPNTSFPEQELNFE